MNTITNTKARGSRCKFTKGPAPPPSIEKKSGLNSALPFVGPEKYPDANEKTVSTKMNINDTVSKGNKVNSKTKSFEVIETFG